MLQARIIDDAPAAPKPEVKVPATNGAVWHPPPFRRFERPDIERHGQWLLPRVVETFRHLDERRAASFLINQLYANEFMFLYNDHAVGLAEIVPENIWQPQPVVWERFVFLQDKEDTRHIEEGADFYTEFARWAQMKRATTIVVEQATDVPREDIKRKLGRIFSQETWIAKAGKE